MKAERAKLDRDDVRQNLNRRAAVETYVRELGSQISLRADRIALDYDAFTAILSLDAAEQRRLKRKPSLKQMTVALITQRKACADLVLSAKAERDRAEAAYRSAVRADAAARGAELAYTGFSG
uniref:hypothetical protein n=1 Tax=uncultured Sphingomonas sp. TaxID=158754 RepID=UPI0035CB1783